jgi:hypothetical protein
LSRRPKSQNEKGGASEYGGFGNGPWYPMLWISKTADQHPSRRHNTTKAQLGGFPDAAWRGIRVGALTAAGLAVDLVPAVVRGEDERHEAGLPVVGQGHHHGGFKRRPREEGHAEKVVSVVHACAGRGRLRERH